MAAKRQSDSPKTRVEAEGKNLKERKRFSRFSPGEARLLAELRPFFEEHADSIVEQFYRHLSEFESLQPLLSDPDLLRRLKQQQRNYLLSLVTGKYGKDYYEDRLKIGRAHEGTGLLPQWYLGTYCLYLDLLIPLVIRHFKNRGDQATRASIALAKLMNLDAQIVLDAYFEIRQQKALERTEHLAAVGELAASIAHEVRNPLAGMKGALDVLRKDLGSNPSMKEVMDELVAQIVRLETLVRDLLSFAQPRPLNRQPIDLNALLDRVLRFAQDGIQESGIQLRRFYDSDPGRIVADAEQLEQVFLNLIHNAIQAMERGGTLTLTTQCLDDSIRIAFQDTGKGIPPAHLQRIFQPFFTTKHRGSGLGLPIVQKIVEAHGGSIQVKSNLDRGTRVTIQMPRRPTD